MSYEDKDRYYLADIPFSASPQAFRFIMQKLHSDTSHRYKRWLTSSFATNTYRGDNRYNSLFAAAAENQIALQSYLLDLIASVAE